VETLSETYQEAKRIQLAIGGDDEGMEIEWEGLNQMREMKAREAIKRERTER
jgi:hypothetical protein